MKWFKHDTDARQDFKIKRLLKRFGIEGYGVYWAIIELLAFETKDSLDVRLSLDAFPEEDIAHDLCVDKDRLKAILVFMAEVGLIDKGCFDSNVLCCKALSKRADDYSQRQRRGANRVRSSTDQVPLEERIREEKTEEEKRGYLSTLRDDITARWNATELPKILSWSSVRIESLRVRSKDKAFVDQYPVAIERLGKSAFALGNGRPKNPGEKPWKATIDWFLENDNNYVKVLEGKYDDHKDAFAKYERLKR